MTSRPQIATRALLATGATALIVLIAALCLLALPSARAGAVAPAPAGISLAYITESASSLPSVWVVQGDGSQARRLGPGAQPLIAPNGQSVAAALFGTVAGSQETGPAIAIYPTAGGVASSYLDLATATASPLAWSADSRYLAVALQSAAVSNAAAGSGLDVIDTLTGAVTPIASGQISGASFAADGSDRIVFGRARSLSVSAASNLYVSEPGGGGASALTHDGRSLNPVWGVHYIAYDHERMRGRDEAPLYQIWLRSTSTEAAHPLTHVHVAPLLVGLVPLSFSSAGGIVAEFEGEDTSEAWTVRLPSGRARRLSSHGRPVMAAGASHGGRVLLDEGFFEESASSGRVVSVSFNGGHPKLLVAHGSQASWNG